MVDAVDDFAEGLRPGDPSRIDGYRLVARLGEGGQGTVFLAHDAAGARVALKVLLPEVVADPVARERIAAEVALARRVPSFCTARLLGARLDGARPYLVNEYVPGPSLAQRVRRAGPVTGSELERLMVGTLTALVTIHRAGVVHHDLKPENILLGPDGPRVVDFGIALRAGARDPQADADGVLGSAAFLAPERLDAGPATPASDVFGWAATMVHAATGHSPFHAPTSTGVIRAVEHGRARLDGLPGGLRPLVERCLSKDPARRPTASAALTALLEALQPESSGDAGSDIGSGTGSNGTTPPPWGTPAEASPAPATAPQAGRPVTGRPVTRTATPTQPTAAPGVIFRPPASPPVAGQLIYRPWPPPPPPPTRERPSRAKLVLGTVAVGVFAVLWASGSTIPEPQVNPEVAQEAPGPRPGWADTVAVGSDGVQLVDPAAGTVGLYTSGTGSSYNVTPLRATGIGAGFDSLGAESFSADGRTLAVLSATRTADGGTVDITVQLWDPATGKVSGAERTLSGSGEGTAEVALSRDGSVIAASVGASQGPSTAPGQVRVWRRKGGQLLDLTVPGLNGDLTVSPDGAWVSFRVGGDEAASDRGHQRLVHVPDGRTKELPGHCLGEIALDPAGRQVFCQVPGRIRVLDTAGALQREISGTAQQPWLLQVSPDGTRLVQSDAKNGEVHVLTVQGRQLVATRLPDAGQLPAAVAFGPDSREIAVVGGDQYITARIDVPPSP